MPSALLLCFFWLTKHAVDSARLSAPEMVFGAYGGPVTVSCHYEPRFREYSKYWCKGPVFWHCAVLVRTPGKLESDRCSITDDKAAGVFSVTMTEIRESDQDTYWCVIDRTRKDEFARVRLLVTQQVITLPTITTSQTTRDELCWWAILRWILFILMFCCLVSTHLILWWLKVPRTIWCPQLFIHQNSNTGMARKPTYENAYYYIPATSSV